MAIKGLSRLVVAEYTADNNKVTYTNPQLTEKMSEYALDITQTEDNPLYLDNGIAEMDNGIFETGQLTINTGNLSQETSIRILGIKEKDFTVNGKQVKELIYDDKISAPALGVGLIELHQVNNVDKYKGIWIPKVVFKIPNDSAKTKGKSVEWQTKEIVGTVMRSDEVSETSVHPWKNEAWFDSEADALEYLMIKGGKTAGGK